MPNSRSWIRSVLSALSLVLSLLGWVILSPDAIGGNTSYIILIGNSMEPEFKLGDLVLVQPASHYKVGDIVAYNQPNIGTIFHRIVGITDEGFVLKGDHNSWEDSYYPDENEILGKFWIKVPSVGSFLRNLRKPWVFTMIVILFAGLIFLTLGFGKLIKTKSYNEDDDDSIIKNQKEDDMDKKTSDIIYIISAVAFIALILAIASFSQPQETTVADNYEYNHIGSFEYYSYVPDDVFEGNILQSGDPIFRQLNNSFNIIFSYELSSNQPASIQGTYRLLARISESSGWERTVEIIPPSSIVENSFISEGVVELSQIQALTENFEEQTGIFNNKYTLTIMPEIIIQGTIGGRNFSDTFMPELPFSFDDQKLILIENNPDESDVLNPIQNSVVLGSKIGPNSISILGFDLNIIFARTVSLFGLLFSTIALVLFFFGQKKTASNQKPGSISDQTDKNV